MVQSRPRGNPVALIYPGIYGQHSEVWIYRHTMGLTRYDSCVVTPHYVNREQYPHPSVALIHPSGTCAYRWAQCQCAAALRRWPTTERLHGWRLAQIADEVHGVLAHVHFLWNARVALRAAEIGRLPFIVTAHGSDVHRALVDDAYRTGLRPVFEGAARIIAVSEFIGSTLRDIGCPPEKIVVQYLGVPCAEEPADVTRDSDSIRVVSVGAFKEVKGHRYLLAAFAKAREKEQRLHLTLVGDGPLRGALEQQAREAGVEGHVEFAGELPNPEVRALLSKCHLYAQHSVAVFKALPKGPPSLREEALGISLAEAAASGLPIVATRTGGVPEIVRHGQNGFLVAQKDVDAMGERIVELAGDAGLRQRLGENGRDLVARDFNEQKQLAKLERLYDQVVLIRNRFRGYMTTAR